MVHGLETIKKMNDEAESTQSDHVKISLSKKGMSVTLSLEPSESPLVALMELMPFFDIILKDYYKTLCMSTDQKQTTE